jgi:large subunit ribosomal protein L29
MTTAKELTNLTVDDLERRAGELRQELFQDLLKLRTGTLDSPAARLKKKRELARVLTLITQKKAAPAA